MVRSGASWYAGFVAHVADALAADAVGVIDARFTILQLAVAATITDVGSAANWGVVGHASRDVRAGALGRSVAGLARTTTGAVAADSVGAEVALAIPGRGARVAVTLFARTAAVHAGFVAVHHAVCARDARLHVTSVACIGTITISDALDAHCHAVASTAVVTRIPDRIVDRHGCAVIALGGRARVVVAGRCIAVVGDSHRPAHAVANIRLAITVCRVVDLGSLLPERLNTNGHRAGPVDAIRVVGTISAIHARHAAARAARRRGCRGRGRRRRRCR